jgi:dTDP-4-amino-4,6-dideoxygalactose transaminase
MHGQMLDMPRLVKWAAQKNVKIIEDCAQAHGAQINGKLAGTWGHFGAFSFYPTKNLGALGDAGSLVTDDTDLATNARSYVNYGSVPGNKYQYQFHGINSRLDPIQAALLSVNLKYLDLWNSRRCEIASIYSDNFEKFGIKTLPIARDSVFHHYIVLSENREATRQLLEKAEIKTEIHYPETAAMSFNKFNPDHNMQSETNATSLAKRTLSIPISPWMSESNILRVIKALTSNEVLKSFN